MFFVVLQLTVVMVFADGCDNVTCHNKQLRIFFLEVLRTINRRKTATTTAHHPAFLLGVCVAGGPQDGLCTPLGFVDHMRPPNSPWVECVLCRPIVLAHQLSSEEARNLLKLTGMYSLNKEEELARTQQHTLYLPASTDHACMHGGCCIAYAGSISPLSALHCFCDQLMRCLFFDRERTNSQNRFIMDSWQRSHQ